jgi:hypothetical protein
MIPEAVAIETAVVGTMATEPVAEVMTVTAPGPGTMECLSRVHKCGLTRTPS